MQAGLTDTFLIETPLTAMSDLVHKEAFTEMHKVYSALRLPTVGGAPLRRYGSEP